MVKARLSVAWHDRHMVTGRFAPSPTGDLHVGNLRTALIAWLFARSVGGRFLLRFEDLDEATARPEHEDSQRRDLTQLGLDWDGEVVRQSERRPLYEDAIAQLERAGLTYPCWCSRRDIREAATAPHGPPGSYPGTCRDLTAGAAAEHQATGRPPALRLRTDHPRVTIDDHIHGAHTEVVDDLVLRRGDGTPSYNLVVVIDDAEQGVDEVVRADDLLSSTPRHAHLLDLLGLPRPAWAHVPLVVGADGARLAKRHGAVTLRDRLAIGDTPERIVGRFAESLGLARPETSCSPAELVERFDPDLVPRDPWTLDETDLTNQW